MTIATDVKCDHRVGDPLVGFSSVQCPRCRGKNVYHAFSISPSGLVETLSGFDSLALQLKKIMSESRRPSGYGFDYRTLLNSLQTDPISSISNEIYRVLRYFMDLQQQSKSEGYVYLPTEELSVVNSVQVTRQSDPRAFLVVISVTTKSGQSGSVSQLLQG
jgi:hypothetical protein